MSNSRKKFVGALPPSVSDENIAVEKQLPSAPAIERLITGALMGDDHALAEKMLRDASFLKTEHFFTKADAFIYQVILELAAENTPLDELMVAQKLKQKPADKNTGFQNQLEQIGGAAALEKRKREAARKHDSSISAYARLVMRYYLQREAIEILTEKLEKLRTAKDDEIYELRNEIADSLRAVSDTSYLQAQEADRDIDEALDEPEMRRLCGTLLWENTVGFLFASSGRGKTVLAVQLAVAISKGKGLFPYKNESGETKYLLENDCTEGLVTGFVDLELSKQQFKKRYSNAQGEKFKFGENFIRISVNRNGRRKRIDKEMTIFNDIENAVAMHKIKFLVIDNITKLSPESKSDVEVIQRLMERFEYLRDKYQLTLLIIAHTPKRNNNTQPVTSYDMAGSAIASDFADSIIAINVDNNDDRLKYIKQVKSRDDEAAYGETNVIRCNMESAENGTFLNFSFIGLGSERDHLEDFMKKENQDVIIEAAIKLKIEHPKKGWRTIAEEINWNQSYVTLSEKMKQYALRTKQYEFQVVDNGQVIFKVKGNRISDTV
jgi:AAA domain/DnaB-like helicase N terminal domain